MSNKKNTFISDLHLVCAKDEMRPAFQCIHFKNGFAYATNGNVMVKQPIAFNPILNSDILDGMAIHAESFRAIRRMRTVIATEDGFECISKDGSKVFYEYAKEVDAPDFEAVLNNGSVQPIHEIAIPVRLVGLLNKAMAGSLQLKMEFRGSNKGVIFKPMSLEHEGELAIVMPMMINE